MATVADEKGVMDALSDASLWAGYWTELESWFNSTLASWDTLNEIGVILLAAAIAWPLSLVLRDNLAELGERHDRIAILHRLWFALRRLAFPIIWLFIQWSIGLLMTKLGYRDGLIVVTSSLLTAWVVISIVTVFIANPLGSRFVAISAWLIASLNIVGYLDQAIAYLRSSVFSVGQIQFSLLTIVQGLVALSLFLWITAILGQLLESRIKSSPNLTPSVKVLTTKLVRIALAVVAFVFALSVVGIDLTAFAVFGGAVGVGLGFGLQKIFANLISGFILLVDKSIKPGDVVAVGESYGRVDALGSRYVSVLTRDGIEHLIPNEELITTRVENWSHSHDLLRLRKMVGVHYKSDLRKAMALCIEALDETPRILKDPPPVCLVREFGDSSVDLEMRFWINDPMNGRANVVSPLLLAVWDKFHAHGIEIPYPQRDLHLQSPADFATLMSKKPEEAPETS